jgi:predicted component of type VI protein secretion system
MSIESLRALMTASRNRDDARTALTEAFDTNASDVDEPKRLRDLLDAYDTACRAFLVAAQDYNTAWPPDPALHYRHT